MKKFIIYDELNNSGLLVEKSLKKSDIKTTNLTLSKNEVNNFDRACQLCIDKPIIRDIVSMNEKECKVTIEYEFDHTLYYLGYYHYKYNLENS